MSDFEENARLHIASLRGNGWTTWTIAKELGIGITSLRGFIAGNSSPWVAANVVKLKLGTLPTVDNPLVPRHGAVRRIQALLYMGWSHEELRRRSGLYTRVILWNDGSTLTKKTHDRICELYRELSHQRGPSPRSTTWAKKRGYAGPADWDNIDFDEAPEKSTEYCVADGCLLTPLWMQPSIQVTQESRVGRLCRKHAAELEDEDAA